MSAARDQRHGAGEQAQDPKDLTGKGSTGGPRAATACWSLQRKSLRSPLLNARGPGFGRSFDRSEAPTR